MRQGFGPLSWVELSLSLPGGIQAGSRDPNRSSEAKYRISHNTTKSSTFCATYFLSQILDYRGRSLHFSPSSGEAFDWSDGGEPSSLGLRQDPYTKNDIPSYRRTADGKKYSSWHQGRGSDGDPAPYSTLITNALSQLLTRCCVF